MKILIADDMEGISGITSWDQVDPENAEYRSRCRHWITADVNAAVQGALDAGAKEIVVADGHWNSSNVLLEELLPPARLNTGTPSPFSMVEGVQYGDVDAALFIGYHARAGSLQGILDHTWSSVRVANVWLNDRLVGEFGLNAAVCGHFGVPVLMISGDQTVCAEAREWVPEVFTAQVKRATSRWAAECLPFEESRALIRETARKAIEAFAKKKVKPLKLKTPLKGVIEFKDAHMADGAQICPGVERIDGRKIGFSAKDAAEAYLTFRSLVKLAT